MEKKNNFIKMVVSSVLCLLPVIFALMVYNDLPERIVMQWNLEGNPNWDAPKAVAAFGLPVFFLLLNIFTKTVVNNDLKKQNISKAMRVFMDWLMPFLSLTLVPIILFMALGKNIPIVFITFIFIGLFFILIGNYLPKNRQNNLAGIRISWTLNDPDNWNKTHRLTGFLFICGGIFVIIMSFLTLSTFSAAMIILSIIAILVIIPVKYSYFLYKKGKNSKKNG